MENKFFTQALSNFTSDVAYVGAVRHLHDLGFPIEAIADRLDYPVSKEKIADVIKEYEQEKNSPDAGYIYVQDVDSYGRKSFRRVKKMPDKEQ